MNQLRLICHSCCLGCLIAASVGCATWSKNTLDLSRPDAFSQAQVTRSKDGPQDSISTVTGDRSVVMRGQSAPGVAHADYRNEVAPGTGGHFRHGMPVSGNDYSAQPIATRDNQQSSVQPAQYAASAADNLWQAPAPRVAQLPPGAPAGQLPPAPASIGQVPAGSFPETNYVAPSPQQPTLGGYGQSGYPQPQRTFQNPGPLGPPQLPDLSQAGQTWGGPQRGAGVMGVPTPFADIFVNVAETQTGKLMIGAAVNSDAGVTGQLVIDERNFDWQAIPTSFEDFASGGAFRGAGQGFRLEALPGNEVQRYMLQFTEPYLLDTRISMNLSAYLFDRRYFDWDEQRLGGRLGFGYRVGPDLSLGFSVRAEEIKIRDPRIAGVAALDVVTAREQNELYSGRVTLTQDTRNIPFAPTQGYFLELAYEQAFGTFDYGRFEGDFRRYFLLAQRPDNSGRHVLGFKNRVGISGEETPIFENFFAGGYQTLRGFDFRRAVPMDSDIGVGGRLRLLGSVEYLFPITADDMLKGVVFTDYGTVEEDIKIEGDDFRVALGLGLRITVPMMGPAPIALDWAVPVAREDTDEIRNFSFFMGASY